MDSESSGWAIGWTAFAGIMMVMGGVRWIISGIVAIANDEFFVVTPEYNCKFDVTTWDPIWVIVFIAVSVFVIWL